VYAKEYIYLDALAKFVQILRILNETCKPALVQNFSKLKVDNLLGVSILLYGSEI
jgi:hypothetical protein